MSRTQRSWWGWGETGQALSDEDCAALHGVLPGLAQRPVPVPTIEGLELPPPRVPAPAALAHLISTAPPDRAGHTYGKAYRDVVRALDRDLAAAPDLVAFARTEADVVDLLDWAGGHQVAVIPYGAGSSVVGGVEYRGNAHAGVLSLDLSMMDQVVEVDRTSRAARIQAGTGGPQLEDQLRPHGLTLRHFPQSFEFSTVGGWLATRSGGHYATRLTHIDDSVESLRVVTGAGIMQSWRLPGSGAGPSPDRLFLGSEGTLGVITEGWLRLQDRPRFRASVSVRFRSGFVAALDAVRAIAQSGLEPSNCRLLDPGEAALSGAASDSVMPRPATSPDSVMPRPATSPDSVMPRPATSPDSTSVLVLGLESAHHPVDTALAELIALARDHGGDPSPVDSGGRDVAAQAWRSAFLRAPYLRDGMARMGAIVETFETACTWDRVATLYDAVRDELGGAIAEVTGSSGTVNARLTHVYPDGAAPYFTVLAAGRPGQQVAMWDELKLAAMEILTRHRATVTHHHAVGRDHRPGYDRQRPEPFALALRAAKSVLDPHGILNPGVLI